MGQCLVNTAGGISPPSRVRPLLQHRAGKWPCSACPSFLAVFYSRCLFASWPGFKITSFWSHQMHSKTLPWISSLTGMWMYGLVKLIIFCASDCRSRSIFRHPLQSDVGIALFRAFEEVIQRLTDVFQWLSDIIHVAPISLPSESSFPWLLDGIQ